MYEICLYSYAASIFPRAVRYFMYAACKGQIISKGLLVSSKNKQTNSFLLLRQIRLFVFWENSRTPKSPFEII